MSYATSPPPPLTAVSQALTDLLLDAMRRDVIKVYDEQWPAD
jgi:hypothetical protein